MDENMLAQLRAPGVMAAPPPQQLGEAGLTPQQLQALQRVYAPNSRLQGFALAGALAGNKGLTDGASMLMENDQHSRKPVPFGHNLILPGSGEAIQDPSWAADRQDQRALTLATAQQRAMDAKEQRLFREQQQQQSEQLRRDAMAQQRDLREQGMALQREIAQGNQALRAEGAGGREEARRIAAEERALKGAMAEHQKYLKYQQSADGKGIQPADGKQVDFLSSSLRQVGRIDELSRAATKDGVKVGDTGGVLSNRFTEAVDNTLARNNLPFASDHAKRRTDLWQEVNSLEAIRRHELFGASLTTNEQASWDAAASFNQGMDNATLQKRVDKLKGIMEAALHNKAAGLEAGGTSGAALQETTGGLYRSRAKPKDGPDKRISPAALRLLQGQGLIEPPPQQTAAPPAMAPPQQAVPAAVPQAPMRIKFDANGNMVQ